MELAVRVVENGFSVVFHRPKDLLAALERHAEVRPRRLRGSEHMNVALLVIDEVGFAPMAHQKARLRRVSYRYGPVLGHMYTELPGAKTPEQHDALLPHRLDLQRHTSPPRSRAPSPLRNRAVG